jgi:hypothetical protein
MTGSYLPTTAANQRIRNPSPANPLLAPTKHSLQGEGMGTRVEDGKRAGEPGPNPVSVRKLCDANHSICFSTKRAFST